MSKPQKKPIVIDSTPLNWQVPTIESVCKIKSSAMSYKQLLNAPNVHNGIRVIGVKVSDMNLPGNKIKFHSANLERKLDEKDALKRTVPKNSIVFPKRGAAIATNKKRLTVCETVLDPNLIAVTPSDTVDHHYLFYWFNTFDLKRITAPGPTPQLNKKDIAPLKFPLPPLPEQKKIAHVLTTVQRAIEAQEQIIQTTTELKKALMHKLFTQGLRNEPQKQTEIGHVPESWEVVPFHKFATLQRGYDLRKQDFKEGEVPVIGATQVIGYHDTANVNAPGVTVVRSGSSAGKPQFIAEDFWAHNVLLYVKDFHGNAPKFVYYKIMALDLTQYRQGVAVPTLNRNTFSSIELALPSPKEQQEIADSLDVVGKRTEVAERKKIQLQALLRTLLNELMTAKIRVTGISISTTI